jgi:hypothetical protein
MKKARLTIFILGLSAGIVPARASLTYYCSNGCGGSTAQFTTQATVTDGLSLSSLVDFTGALTQFGSVANDEYIDSTTGVEFIAFNASGTTNKAFAGVSGGNLNLTASSGDSIEVILPASTYGIGFNFTTAFSNGETLCLDPTTSAFSSCDSGGTFITQSSSGFVGTLNDNPAPAPFTTIWLNAQNAGSGASTDLQSFEIATQTEAPDAATGLTLGTGLILISLLYRRVRLLRAHHR